MTKPNWSLLAALRFALALIVAGAHTTSFTLNSISMGFDSLGAKAAVVGFLLVSGFSIAASLDRDKKQFYFRRFKRIYPVYFFSVLAAIALELWLGTIQLPHLLLESNGAVAAIGNLLLLQTFLVKPIAFNGLVWSLAVEVSFYIAAPFLRPERIWFWLSLIAISGAYYILPKNDANHLYTLALKLNAVRYFWPFGMGFVLYHYRSALLAFTFGVVGTTLVWLCVDNDQAFAPMTFIASFGVLLIARAGAFSSSSPLDYLGDLSYPLYLVQIPVYILAFKLGGITNPLVLLALAILAACVTFEIVDRRLKALLFSKALNKAHGALNAAKPL